MLEIQVRGDEACAWLFYIIVLCVGWLWIPWRQSWIVKRRELGFLILQFSLVL